MLLLLTNQPANTCADIKKIETCLREMNIPFKTKLTRSDADTAKIISRIDTSTISALAIYGGDGTVAPTLITAAKKNLPVLILPGGTDNSLARSTKTPLEWKKSLDSYANNTYLIKYVQLANADTHDFVADIHFGWAARSLNDTSPQLKRLFGRFAYTIHAFRARSQTNSQVYSMELDGKEVDVRGYSCFIANLGNPQLPGVTLFRANRIGDLKVAILRKKTTFAILRWYFLRRFNLNDPYTVYIKHAQKVELIRGPKTGVIDEKPITINYPMTIQIAEPTVKVIVPLAPRYSIISFIRWWHTAYYRNTDQLRRMITGVPSERFGLISHNLYLGGQYGKNIADEFKRRGITGVVSMRTYIPKPFSAHNIKILHLPTVDRSAPSIENLDKGVAFIKKHTSAGGKVYVHCRQGEGRGPTMAAAYLISEGMRPQDAVAHLKHFRPFANPTKPQVKRLAEFWEHCHGDQTK